MTTVALAALLLLTTVLVYAPVAGFEFLTYDDPDYVTRNPWVLQGPSWAGLRWAFLNDGHASNWHPLTWLSHMLDVRWFGLEAGRHHLVNAALHALDAALLFVALRALTRALWSSALVAALFALHPLRVESVAWISERKDLLAGLFFCLLLLAYSRHARRPDLASDALLLALLALGLMAKPMLVSVPFVLLLLDWWPLGRFRGGTAEAPLVGSIDRGRSGRGLLLEKLPLLLLAALSSAVTLWSQERGGSLHSLETIPLSARLANAPLACVGYLSRSFWPAGLAYFYPHASLVAPERPSWDLRAFAALALLLGVSVLAWRLRRSRPWLLVGWLWFLGMLAPVIGLVQVGEQSRADRYAYLPLVGLQLALVWSARELVARVPRLRLAAGLAAVAVLLACALATRAQLRHWKDSEALYTRAIEVTEENYAARVGLANVFAERGELDRARRWNEEALAIHPDYVPALYDLALLEQHAGQAERAIELYRRALERLPDFSAARLNLGSLLAERGEDVDAALEFEGVLELVPDHPDAHFNLAQLLLKHGELEKAVEHLELAVRARADHAAAWERLGVAREAQGRDADAIAALRSAVGAGGTASAARLLAWILATSPEDSLRDGPEALRLARRIASQTNRADAALLQTLAAALAENGDFARAADAQARALELLPAGQRAEAHARLELYRAERPYRHFH